MKRVALITGAGTGIGRASALRLVAMQHRVALIGRTPGTLQSVAEEISAAGGGGGEALVVPADVSQPEQVAGMVKQVAARWGRIDVLVNAAGMVQSMPIVETTPALWHQLLEANLSSAFYTTRAVWPFMVEQHRATGDGGVIVNISSMAAKNPFAGLGAYAVAKAGINMLSLVTAREGEAVGIRVVAIAPGAVDTGMFRALVGEENVHPEQILRAEDVAAAVVDVVSGSLRYASGDTVYLHRRPI